MKIIIMGSGTSLGVPVIGCGCEVCASSDPRNKRTRASICVQAASGKNILVDTATELRLQAIRNGIRSVEMILFTHYHADHIHGLDDVRVFNWVSQGSLPCYADKVTNERLKRVFFYAFEHDYSWGAIPRITLNDMPDELRLEEIRVTPVKLLHGHAEILGFRFNDAAYLTDCSAIPETSVERLFGLKLLIIDALRYKPHPTHFNLEGAIDVVERLKPERALLTHLSHEFDHAKVEADLPAHIGLSYDGQIIELPVEEAVR
ncbi:MAG: MBL fold metallo-hydrolase [Candidatus Abyssobacteria bacterium SURF_17]|jgi:phosphoribosyl 1,2-cyclic phosphate phosphodiesterase|uniref:MBL fold metallo-hydrolase n=1 Tax=Candidatus Abyssobacteria bacterium SURF_17 TaxID=2093361 RepID=A0A419F994_9BACT|nr:MAG: MBL fold metallo-hydrolase [Candidatus Abyssubacteria bacterium SURF_17]